MASRPISIFIPLAGHGGSADAVCHILAQKRDTVASAAGFDPSIAALAHVELQTAGQVALDAFKSFTLRQPLRRNFRLTLPKTEGVELHCVNSMEVIGLASNTSASAELGLALGLILGRFRSKQAVVFATGELSREDGVLVQPVGSLTRKFNAVGRWIATHKGALGTQKVKFFVPAMTSDGHETVIAHHAEIEALKGEWTKAGVRLDVVPVGSLTEAVASLGIDRAQIDRREILARLSLMLATFVLAAAIWLMAWAIRPTTLEFEALDWPLGTDPETPVSLSIDVASGSTVPGPHCFGPDGRLHIKFGDYIAVRARQENSSWFDLRPAINTPLIVIFGENSRATLIPVGALPPLDRPKRNEDGHLEFSVSIPILPPQEAMKLAILSRKIWNHDWEEINAKLQVIYQETTAGEPRLAETRAYLEALPGTYLDTDFRAVEDLDNCRNARW